MTEREKLTELIINADTYDSYECKLCTKDDDACDCCHAEKLADHLLSNGVIVPPCKVGDTVYAISDIRIKECACYDMSLGKELIIVAGFRCDYDCEGCPFNSWSQDHTGEHSCQGEYGEWYFSLDDFGKTVFLSREDAERALKERSEGK